MAKAVEKELSLEKTLQADNLKKENNDNVNASAKGENAYKYKREDCETGYLTDPLEIEEFIRNQQIDIYQNALLGDYGSDGTYYLPDEIADELLKARKVITNNYENYIFAQSIKPIGEYGVAKFFITVSKLEKGLIATLTFVEPVHKMNKLVINAQAVQISAYSGDIGEQFYYEMKQEFNIVDDDFVVPSDEDNFKYSLKRKKQRSSVWEESLKGIELTEKEIYNKRIEVLNKLDNEYSKGLLDLMKGELAKKGAFFDNSKNRYTCLNQLLDECISIMSGRFPDLEVIALRKMREVTAIFANEQKTLIDVAKDKVLAKKSKEMGTKTFSSGGQRESGERAKDEYKKSRTVAGSSYTSIKDENVLDKLGDIGGINPIQSNLSKNAPINQSVNDFLSRMNKGQSKDKNLDDGLSR